VILFVENPTRAARNGINAKVNFDIGSLNMLMNGTKSYRKRFTLLSGSCNPFARKMKIAPTKMKYELILLLSLKKMAVEARMKGSRRRKLKIGLSV
jgi:hypothetical protein